MTIHHTFNDSVNTNRVGPNDPTEPFQDLEDDLVDYYSEEDELYDEDDDEDDLYDEDEEF